MTLFCFDLDGVLFNGNSNDILELQGYEKAPVEVVEKLIDDHGLKYSNEFLEIMRLALKNNHHIATVSFTSYPEVVIPVLTRIGLTKGEITQIKIICMPKRPRNGKISHIIKAIEHFNLAPGEKDVWLIDDERENIEIAAKHGFKTILVTQDTSFFEELNEAVIQLNNKPALRNRLGVLHEKPSSPIRKRLFSDVPHNQEKFWEKRILKPKTQSSIQDGKENNVNLKG